MNVALITFATAVFIAGVTLAGVYLTNMANTERLKLQLEHESTEKPRGLRRERAEELYELTDDWLKCLYVTYLNLSFVMQGKFDYHKYLNQIIEHGNNSKSKVTTQVV